MVCGLTCGPLHAPANGPAAWTTVARVLADAGIAPRPSPAASASVATPAAAFLLILMVSSFVLFSRMCGGKCGDQPIHQPADQDQWRSKSPFLLPSIRSRVKYGCS